MITNILHISKRKLKATTDRNTIKFKRSKLCHEHSTYPNSTQTQNKEERDTERKTQSKKCTNPESKNMTFSFLLTFFSNFSPLRCRHHQFSPPPPPPLNLNKKNKKSKNPGNTLQHQLSLTMLAISCYSIPSFASSSYLERKDPHPDPHPKRPRCCGGYTPLPNTLCLLTAGSSIRKLQSSHSSSSAGREPMLVG